MIKISDRSSCCGCTACKSICPYDAISMKPDNMGFLYPIVDLSKCVDCGLCEKVCAFNASYDKSKNLSFPYFYAVRHKDINEVSTSRSGAAFIALSDWILDNGGVVYGAGYVDHFRVAHKRAETKAQRNEFKGSKYVQSDLNDTFKQIKKDLLNGKWVLFSGTPCQTSGLSSYIGPKLRSNLFLVDIVCHGVPSPYIWRDYLKYTENKRGENAIAVDFRDKTELGWAAHKESFTFPSGKEYRKTYTYLFYEHIMFRPSCKVCYFANFNRPSDLTLADFWGWQNADINLNSDDKGISLLICNTDKGKQLFDNVIDSVKIMSVEQEKCIQPNLQNPSIFNSNYVQFEKDYIERGFKYIARKYGDLGMNYLFKRLKQKSRTAIRLLLKK